FDSYPSTALIAAPCPFRPASSRPANRDTVPQVFNGRINGRFAPGYSGNPGGSPDRARKALNAETIAELHRAFRIGGRQAINKVMRNQPAVFLKLLVLLVPREMKVEQSGGVKEMTDEQIERGIELIKEILAQREPAANAKVVEGTAETVALPAPYVVPDGPNKVMDVADTAVGARERKPRKRKAPSPTSVIS